MIPHIVSPGPFSLGEGCLWDHRLQRLYWIDINERKLAWLDRDGITTIRDLPGTPGTVVLTSDPAAVALALDNGIHTYQTDTGLIHRIAAYPESPATRFNDGKCDSAGRFWVGTMSREGNHGAGTLYCLTPGRSLESRVPSVTVSNGLCWSRDDQTFYFIDSATREVHAFDFDPGSGAISGRRVAVAIPPDRGYPDGMTIDSQDRLWVAHWMGGCVACYDPITGETVAKIDLPTPRVTSCCFGGEDFRTLYITTAIGSPDGGWTDLDEYPQTGAIFALTLGVGGRESNPLPL